MEGPNVSTDVDTVLVQATAIEAKLSELILMHEEQTEHTPESILILLNGVASCITQIRSLEASERLRLWNKYLLSLKSELLSSCGDYLLFLKDSLHENFDPVFLPVALSEADEIPVVQDAGRGFFPPLPETLLMLCNAVTHVTATPKRSNNERIVLRQALRLLHETLSLYGIHHIFVSSATPEREDTDLLCERVLSRILSLPERTSDLRALLPSEMNHWIHSYVDGKGLDYILHCSKLIVDITTSIFIATLQAPIPPLCISTLSRICMRDCFLKACEGSQCITSLVPVFLHLTPMLLPSLLDHVFAGIFNTSHGSGSEIVAALLDVAISQGDTDSSLSLYLFDTILHRTRPSSCACIQSTTNIALFVLEEAVRRHPSAVLSRSLPLTASLWSDRDSFSHSTFELDRRLTCIVAKCLSYFTREELSSVVSTLMGGVHERMGSNLEHVRFHGMDVGEAVSVFIDGTTPLEFDIERPSIWESETKDIDRISDEENCENSSDALVVKQNDEDDFAAAMGCELDNDSDDSLEEYDLEETDDEEEALEKEDLDENLDSQPKKKRVRAPMYLRECLKMLGNQEDRDEVNVALSTAPAILRSIPDDIEELCSPFLLRLLHMRDSLAITSYQHKRYEAMVCATIACPLQAFRCLVKEFYGREYSLQQRYDILVVIARAVESLHNVDTQESEGDGKSMMDNSAVYFRGTSSTQVPKIVNRFQNVASELFFPLLSQYDKSTDSTYNLVERDSMLLAQLLFTLGTCLRCSVAGSLEASRMGSELCCLIVSLRYHADAVVRRALLYGLLIIASYVPEHVLAEDLLEEVIECLEWVRSIADFDGDRHCRELAVACAISLSQHLPSLSG